MHKNETELEQIISHSPAVAILRENAPGWPVAYVSENVSGFGYSPEDFGQGVNFADIVHPDDLSRIAEEINQAHSGEIREFDLEYRVVDPSGNVRWVGDNVCVRMGESGHVTHYQGVLTDITRRKQAEVELETYRDHLEQLVDARTLKMKYEIEERRRVEAELKKHREQLEDRVREELEKRRVQEQLLIQKSKLESLGGLAAGIAHEINQPLARIAMGSESLLLKALENEAISNEYIEKKCQIIQVCIDRITRIIDHTRIFSRDQQAAISERIDVNETVENALMFVGSQYQHHNIAIQKDLSATGRVLGNPYRLEQVILNLLANAKDAIEEKHELIESAFDPKWIFVNTKNDGERVRIEVEDTGMGMSEKTVGRIFDPFFTTKDVGLGTGLGLSVAYGIVREMNGEIIVSSEPGKGTVMTVVLPILADSGKDDSQ